MASGMADSVTKATTGALHEPAWLVYVVPFATVVLVAVTIWNALLVRKYTLATQRMVDEMGASSESQAAAVEEMRRSREAEIRPVLVPHTELLDPRQAHAFFGIKNVGKGPALSVDVFLRWTEITGFRLRCPLIESGGVRLVKMGTHGTDPDVINPDSLEQGERTLLLTGQCDDVAGIVHTVDTRAPLFDQWEHHVPEEIKSAIEAEGLAMRDAARAAKAQEQSPP